MNKEQNLIKIRDCLIKIEQNIQYDTRAGLFNLNKLCENFYCKLFKLVYGYELVNANLIKRNFEAVDLIDDKNLITIQVTSDNSRNKIQTTINKFISKELYKKYKRLIIFIISEKDEYKKEFDTGDKFKFDKEKDILDNKDIYSYISNLEDNERIYLILQYLEKELKSNPLLFNFDDITKSQEVLTNLFVNRSLCNSIDYDEYYVSKYNSLKTQEVLEKEKRIILLSDAGFGKSELCKSIVNEINLTHKNECAFYYKLINYTNQKIEDLKPDEYKDIPNLLITFVLDGYDEIISNNKKIFIKEIQQFITQNENVRIIISSRTNFYTLETESYSGTIPKFKSFYILPFANEDLKEMLRKANINYTSFINEVSKKNLVSLINNPFYVTKMIEKYSKDKILYEKNVFISQMIYDSFNFDVDKYNTTIDLLSVRNKLFKILKLLSLSMAFLERNYLSIYELDKLITSEEDRELLIHSGIWKKENDKYLFVHNNFWEFLASEMVKELPLDKIKKIISYDEKNINPFWINIIAFLIDSYDNEDFRNWLIDIYPDCIFYFEKDCLSYETRIKLFKNMFNYYETKKIWLPNSIYHNDRFAKFVYSKENITFLLDKIVENNHYTIVFNALNILSEIEDFNDMKTVVKEKLYEFCFGDILNTSQKRYIINILSKHKLIDDKEIFEIIEKNKNKEDAYLRAAYFAYLNNTIINNDNINILLDRLLLKKKGYVVTWNEDNDDDEEINLADEHMELEKVFANINSVDVFKKTIDFLEKLLRKDFREILNEATIKNICDSFIRIYKKDNSILEDMLKLYLVFDENYSNEGLKIIPEYLDKINLRLELFKKYISVEKKRRFHSDYYLIDNNCLTYFYLEYEKKNYNDDLAKEIIYQSNPSNIDYEKLNSLYAERTGYNIIEERRKNEIVKNRKGTSKQDYFNSIFDKNIFINNIMEYLAYIKNSDTEKIEKNKIRDIEFDYYDDNEKYNNIKNFLLRFERKNEVIYLSSIEKINWNYFILAEAHYLIYQNSDIKVSDEQINTIEKICNKFLEEVKFEDAIKYKKDGGFSTSYIHTYIWEFMLKYKFVYQETVLLDMLNFEWVTGEWESPNIEFIEKNVSEFKVRERIINNLINKRLYENPLKWHIDYCLRKNITNMSEYIEKYILDKNIKAYDKDNAIDYIIKDSGINLVIEKYLTKVDFETEQKIIQKIFSIDKEVITPYLENKLRNSKKRQKQIAYFNFLIRANNSYGLSKYYELIKREMKCIDFDSSYDNNIKSALSTINSIKLLDTILNILLLTHNKNFKDNKFDRLYSGCQQAIINIALSDLPNNSFKITIDRLNLFIDQNKNVENIGFTHYIIEEINNKYYQVVHKKKTLDEVIKEINAITIKETSLCY